MRRRIRLLAPPLVVLVAAAEMLSLGAQDGLPIPETVVRLPPDPVEQQERTPQQHLPAQLNVSRDSEDAKDALQWKPLPILSSLTTAYTGPSESCSSGVECGETCCHGQTPAACIECPHVTTLSPYFNLRFFGSLNAEMLFAESRPLLPSGVVLISPNFGKDIRSFEAHAKSTNLGIVFQGPKNRTVFSPAVRFSVISTENSFRRIATGPTLCARSDSSKAKTSVLRLDFRAT